MNEFQPKIITPFGFYCQHVLPLVYDQSLSYYEVLCKLQAKLNEVIKTQNDLQDSFVSLQNWIDEQLEMYAGNRLNEWLNDGTIERLLNVTIMNKKLQHYLNVESMKSDITLESGMIVNTTYYYSNDNGGGNYYISDTSLNDYSIQLTNGKYATRIIDKDTCIPIEYGYQINDQTKICNELFNFILNHYKVLVLETGTYYYEFNNEKTKAIIVGSNNTIIGNNATLETLIPFNLMGYSVLNIEKRENVKIYDLNVNGCKELNQATTGEHGHCISIYGSTNVEINNCCLYGAWGDGIELGTPQYGDGYYIDIYANITNCCIHDCRRQGISILDCGIVNIKNCEIYNINGTNPQSGIDIEPFYNNEKLGNINISDCYIHDTIGNSIMYFIGNNLAECNTVLNISNNRLVSIDISQGNLNKLIANISNNYFSGITTNGIRLSHIYKETNKISCLNNILEIENVTGVTDHAPISFVGKPNNIYGNIDVEAFIILKNGNPNNRNIITFNTFPCENVHVKANTEKMYAFSSLMKDCSLENNVEWKTWYYQPFSQYIYYNKYILQDYTQPYEFNSLFDTQCSVIYHVQTNLRTSGKSVILKNNNGNILPFGKNQITCTENNALLDFYIDENKNMVVTNMTGNWS